MNCAPCCEPKRSSEKKRVTLAASCAQAGRRTNHLVGLERLFCHFDDREYRQSHQAVGDQRIPEEGAAAAQAAQDLESLLNGIGPEEYPGKRDEIERGGNAKPARDSSRVARTAGKEALAHEIRAVQGAPESRTSNSHRARARSRGTRP